MAQSCIITCNNLDNKIIHSSSLRRIHLYQSLKHIWKWALMFLKATYVMTIERTVKLLFSMSWKYVIRQHRWIIGIHGSVVSIYHLLTKGRHCYVKMTQCLYSIIVLLCVLCVDKKYFEYETNMWFLTLRFLKEVRKKCQVTKQKLAF